MHATEQPDTSGLKRTPLYALLARLGAKFAPFAGYEMPIRFPHGIRHEHLHTRRAVSLFDVSHMGQIHVVGDEAARVLERLVPGDITGLRTYAQRYTVLTYGDGGILDDLMVTRRPDGLWLVVNAARKHQDLVYLQGRIGDLCDVLPQPDRALLALQGPEAARVLGELCPGTRGMPFMHAGEFVLNGVSALIHRCGYTGEDGFEISVPAIEAESVAELLLSRSPVEPAGLGARDTLRLEAGLCLYGEDIDQTTTPVEADLSWIIAAKYRGDDAITATFPGAPIILTQLLKGPADRRVGLRPEGEAPVRAGTGILDADGVEVGIITSGGFGPTVGGSIAMDCHGIRDRSLCKAGHRAVRDGPSPLVHASRQRSALCSASLFQNGVSKRCLVYFCAAKINQAPIPGTNTPRRLCRRCGGRRRYESNMVLHNNI